ncbi:metal ABC transporter substrate-binding protein [Geminicoccus harenae]|uniref:metal ABC transporter substrate-binding protein n=1 Tax=Geminicoccus harenae TaxID=2498453 RepID=UPI00168B7FC5|nr:metal ABC transporter substrate-binding protein [Geminicoccus harenae]
MLVRRTTLLLLSSLALAGAALPGRAADAPLKVVASFSILGDMVRQIGGAHVELATLVGPDGDAHMFEPTPADAEKLASARVLVVNGLGFESWLPRLVEASGFAGRTVVASDGARLRSLDEAEEHDHAHDGHHHGHHDPHAWQDLANGVIYARNIGQALAKADPAHAEDYRRAAEAYASRLQELDAGVRAEIAAIPAERRKVVTAHDAFGYFGDAYGITFIAPVGRSTEAEPSAFDVARIIDQIRQEGISAVFMESSANTKMIGQIAQETGAVIGGALYSDALSGPDGDAPTYERMFAWNARQLARAMAGS